MKKLTLTIFFFAVAAIQAQSSGNANTTAQCSPANTGNNNRFVISCGIKRKQGEDMLAILNKILANSEKLTPDAVNAKLDEILKRINPNLKVKTHECNGRSQTVGPDVGAVTSIGLGGGAEMAAFEQMIALNSNRQYAELLDMSNKWSSSAPEWLTPRLFAATAYWGMYNVKKAKEMLAEYDSQTGPAYNSSACKELSDFLHTQMH